MELAQANLSRFFLTRPDWRRRFGDAALPTLDPAAASAMATPFLADLAAYTPADLRDRFALYRARTVALSAASYRVDVRAGASLRGARRCRRETSSDITRG